MARSLLWMVHRWAAKGVREEQRRELRRIREQEREDARQLKEELRNLQISGAKTAVMAFEAQLELLSSLHSDCSDPVDWDEVMNEPRPEAPDPITTQEDAAREEFDQLSPTLLDRIFPSRLERKKQAQLAKIETAREMDREENENATEDFEDELAEWRENRRIARGVLAGDADTMLDALVEFSDLSEGFAPGTSLEFESVDDDQTLVLSTITISDETFPKEDHRLTKTGKLSTPPMPKRKLRELQFNYTCSSALRVIRDVFTLLPPVEGVLVNVFHDLENEHDVRPFPVLSMFSSRSMIAGVDFETPPLADLIAEFEHRIRFSKSRGFAPITPLDRTEIRANASSRAP